ncbi:MAG: DUF6948 domain-containing protein [Candidatus Nitrosocosmicus sp.]
MSNKRTLEQIKEELMELLEGNKDSEFENSEGLQYVVIRTYSAGVHSGFLKRLDESTQTVELVNARRIYKWSGAFTLSEFSVNGPSDINNCKFSVTIPSIILLEAIEVIPTTIKAQKIICGVKNYEVN